MKLKVIIQIFFKYLKFEKHFFNVKNIIKKRDKLGTGINGSVIRVQRRSDNTLGALKIIYKNAPRAEAEVKLHAFATQCPHVSFLFFRLNFICSILLNTELIKLISIVTINRLSHNSIKW